MRNPNCCPNCGADNQINAEYGSIEIDGDTAFQPVTCMGCHASWIERYDFNGIDDLDLSDCVSAAEPTALPAATRETTRAPLHDCPMCGSTEVELGDMDYGSKRIGRNEVAQEVSCDECGAEWRVVYHFDRFCIDKNPDD